MTELPPHEQLKQDLANKFTSASTYLGSFIKQEIIKSDFKTLSKKAHFRPTYIKKGDVITCHQGVKSRPSVIIKVQKDGTCIYIPLTSTENVHCMTESKSRFFAEGCFSKSFSVCTQEFALDNFVGVYDNMKYVNKAIKELKYFIFKNI